MGFVKAKGRSATYDYFFCWSRHRAAGCDLPYVPAQMVEAQVEACFESVQVSGEMLLKFRDRVLEQIKMRLDGAEKQAKVARKRIIQLEAERRRLLQAHLGGAVPLELLKEEQNRITRQLAQAGAELANTEVDWEEVQERVKAAVALTSQIHDLYLHAEPTLRRRINQAVWEGFYVDDDGVVGATLTDPMAALVAEDVIRALGAENESRDLCSRGRGSRLNGLVEVSGLEPPTSTLRTSFVHPPEQGLSERTSWYTRCFSLTFPQDSSPFLTIRSVKVTSTGHARTATRHGP